MLSNPRENPKRRAIEETKSEYSTPCKLTIPEGIIGETRIYDFYGESEDELLHFAFQFGDGSDAQDSW
jgi:hypothetical protein